MDKQTVLITGGYGCIGSETAKWILRNSNANVVVCSRSVNTDRTNRVFHDVDQTHLKAIEANVCDQKLLEQILVEQEITSVVHMAALQTPDCNAHRDLGLQINLAGTQNLVEAIKVSGQQVSRFVFASSVAVYGPRSAYSTGQVPMLADPRPVNVYGVWKLAGEHVARIFHEDTGIATVCVRPGVLFGPGRDAGLTASPTTAMKCVALGLPYQIPFRSRQDYLYAPDVGGAVANTVLESFDGFGVFTLPSRTLATEEIVAALNQVAGEMELGKNFQITVGDDDVPFICDLDYEPFITAFPKAPHTPLHQALTESLHVFREQVKRNWLTEADIRR